MSTGKTTKNKGLGVPPRKASGSGSTLQSSAKTRKDLRSDPSRKETKHDRMGRMILEIAGAMAFKKSQLSQRQKPVYLFAFVDGARFVQATNRAARERQRQLNTLEALGIVAARPKGGVRSAAKDGTRAKPGASRATPKPLLKKK